MTRQSSLLNSLLLRSLLLCSLTGLAFSQAKDEPETGFVDPDLTEVVEKKDPFDADPQTRGEAASCSSDMRGTHLEAKLAAAERLTKMPGAYATKHAIDELRSEEIMQEVKRKLAEGLKTRLAEKDPDARKKIWEYFVETLGKERSTEVQEPLVRAAASYPDKRVASDELIRFYSLAKNDEVRIAIIQVVGKLGAEGAVKFLESQTKSRFATPRREAVMGLFNHDAELARKLTVRMLHKDDYNQNRIAAVKKLATFTDDACAEEIAKALVKDSSWFVRKAAVEAVKDKPTNEVIAALCQALLSDPKEDIREMVPPIFQSLRASKHRNKLVGVMRQRLRREKNQHVRRKLETAIGDLAR